MKHPKNVEDWLSTLLDYAEGLLEWDTAGVWVCEKHPRRPFEEGTPFDCKCGGPGMPPFTPDKDAVIKARADEKARLIGIVTNAGNDQAVCFRIIKAMVEL